MATKEVGSRAAIIVACIIAVAAAPTGYRRVRAVADRNLAVAALHQKCLAYTIPPGQGAYEEIEMAGGWMITAGSHILRPSGAGPIVVPPDMGIMTANGSAWLVLLPGFLRNPPPAPANIPTIHFDNILFLHGRRAQSGSERLVSVEVNPARPQPEAHFGASSADPWFFKIRVIRSASILSTGRQLSEQKIVRLADMPDPPFKLWISGGQIDPQDSSHFTIDFETPTTYTVDGWLQADDTVLVKVRPTNARKR